MVRFYSITTALLLLALPEVGAGPPTLKADELSVKYNAIIQKTIAQCKSKSCRCDSRSATIRRDAAIGCMKAAYFEAFQPKLIHDMRECQLRPVPYQVRHFLNSRFYEQIRSRNSQPAPHSNVMAHK